MLSFFLHYWDIFLFAGLALWVLFKFYMMLGQGRGIIPKGRGFFSSSAPTTPSAPLDVIEGTVAPTVQTTNGFEGSLAEMKRLDPSFTLPSFLDKAGSAFRFIVSHVHGQTLEAVRTLVSSPLYDAFEKHHATNVQANYVVHFSLEALVRCSLLTLTVDGSIATARVTFVSRQIHYISHPESGLLAGSSSPITQTDTWTFRRDYSIPNGSWILIGTQDA